MKIPKIEVYGDSKLIINQLLNVYEPRKDDSVPFFQQASHLLKGFENAMLNHIPRNENRMANALANLAITLALSEGETTNVPLCNRWVFLSLDTSDHKGSNAITATTNDEDDWRKLFMEYVKHNKLPNDTRHKTEVQRSFKGIYQRCLVSEEVLEAMTEAHSRICDVHPSGQKLYFGIKRMDYY
ncbi:UNVERIFIED_CONTAM: hypothetical protein Scaly_2807400 [Sesamum calycinum]